MQTLLTSGQQTSTAVLLAEAALARGLSVRTADNLSGLQSQVVHWYGGPAAAARVAEVLDLKLLEPPDDWLAKLPEAVVTGSRYATFGHLDVGPLLDSARAFALDVLDDLPSAVVVDVGQIADPATARRTWAVVEANLPWFAQSYGADPARVLDVIQRATGPLSQFAPADRRFLGLDNAADEGQSSNKGVFE